MLKILVGMVAGILVVNAVIGVTRRERLLARLHGGPAERIRFFRSLLIGGWSLAALTALLVIAPGDDLHPSDVGWTWPTGGLAGLTPAAGAIMTGLLSATAIGMIVSSAAQTRARLQAGQTEAFPAALTVMLPRNPRERRLAAGVAVTAGVTEEIVYRGFLIGAVVVVFDAPAFPVAALSVVLFVAGHAYQGRNGLPGITVAALFYTLLFVLSGSVLPGIVVHVVQDLVGLLTIPPAAKPTSTPAAEPTPPPA